MWQKIPGWPHYEVHEDRRSWVKVRSTKRPVGNPMGIQSRRMKPAKMLVIKDHKYRFMHHLNGSAAYFRADDIYEAAFEGKPLNRLER